MLYLSVGLTVFVLLFTCLLLWIIRILVGRSSNFFIKQQQSLGDVNGFIEEMINGQKIVKVFCHEEKTKQEFDKKNDELCYCATQANKYGNITMPIVGNMGYILYVLIAIIGGAAGIAGIQNLSLTGMHLLTIGTIMGAIAGYRGGRADTVIMRLMDMLLAIPSILLAITFMAALGKGIDKAVIAIGLVSIPEYARIVRGCILSVKENDYVQAAKVIGNKDTRIIFKHIMPNILSSIVVRATLGISTAVLDTSALGFLGLGVQPPYAEWGDMLGRARGFIFSAPYTLIFPGIAITITVLAFNLLGDGLRDALDPKSRKI
jgi:ABC-type antimicrobial peptide transport system permease subunit